MWVFVAEIGIVVLVSAIIPAHSGPECNQSAPKWDFANFFILNIFCKFMKARTLVYMYMYAIFSFEINQKYRNCHLKVEI